MCTFINAFCPIGPNGLQPTRYSWVSTQREPMNRLNKRGTWRNWCWDPTEPTSLCSNCRGEYYTDHPTTATNTS